VNPLLIGPLFELVSKGLDRWFPDPAEKAKVQLDLLQMQQAGDFKELEAQVQLSLAQTKINEIEAASSNSFAATWRPAAGWVCVLGLGYEFLLRPLLPWVLTVAQVPGVPALPSLDAVLFELIAAMLGLGGMRSWERGHRVKQLVEAAK
jgi:hypothetical protein